MSFWNLVSGIAGGIIGHETQESTNDANLRIARESFEHDKAMWHEQNEYNKPENQMARYRDAGLNPNLMFGSISPGNATNAPTMSSPRMDNPGAQMAANISALGPQLLQADLVRSQIDKTNAETEAIKVNSGLAAEQTETQKQQTVYWTAKAVSEKVGANVSSATESVQVALKYQSLQNLTAEEKNIYSEIAARNVMNELNREKITSEKFRRGIEKSMFELKKSMFRVDAKMRAAEYGLKYDSLELERYKADQARMKILADMYMWSSEYLLKERGFELQKTRAKINSFFDAVKLPFDTIGSFYNGLPGTSEQKSRKSVEHSSRSVTRSIKDSKLRK